MGVHVSADAMDDLAIVGPAEVEEDGYIALFLFSHDTPHTKRGGIRFSGHVAHCEQACVKSQAVCRKPYLTRARGRYDSERLRSWVCAFGDAVAERRVARGGRRVSDERHEMLRGQMEESEKVREDTRNWMRFEWAGELLVEDDRDEDAPESP